MSRPGPQARSVPRVLLLTDGASVPRGRTLAATVAAALAAGIDGVLVRERALPPPHRRELARQVRVAAEASGTSAALLWAAPAPEGDALGPGAGLHLRAADPFPPAGGPALVGRSCHSAGDLRRAAEEGCDYVTISPVARSVSKPGYGPPLGPDGLRALLRLTAYLSADAPRVLALGGVRPGTARRYIDAGAYGIAVMGEVMRAGDPHAVAARLVAEVTS